MRQDLLALSDDSLAALTNRGIVKRSAREVADGKGPTVSDADPLLVGVFGDGTRVEIAPGQTLEQSHCSCPAAGVCRHRVMVVMAYRTSAVADVDDLEVADGEPPVAAIEWSPASFSDVDLEGHIGKRTYDAARKAFRTGYRARVRRPSAADPVPTVELTACTVRFLVPEQLGYARVDAARGAREDAIALAVWAFRLADQTRPSDEVVDLEVGGTSAVAVSGGSGIEPALSLFGELLADGVTGTGPAIATSIAQARRAMDGRNLRWPVDVLDDVADQLDAYRTRSSRYQPERVARFVSEGFARHRCVSGGGASLRVQVLGTEETAETPLRLLRLTGLGARIRGDDSSRSLEVYLAHAEAGLVLALRRRVDVEEGESLPTADELGRRKAGGARLSVLAGGNVVTETAVRSANRVVRIAESRVGKTSVTPSSGAWESLPEGILVADLDAEAARLAGLPPEVVRARVVAESLRAVVVDEVEDLRYLPGEQRFEATIRAPVGLARVVLAHSAASPGAIDALAKAFSGEQGPLRFVAGHLRRHGGVIDLEPTALVVGSAVVVPAFAPATGEAIDSRSLDLTDRLVISVQEALTLSADLLHRGYRHLPPGWSQRVERSAQQLRQVGLTRAGSGMASLGEVARYGGADLVDRWVDVHLRLLVTAEQL